VKEVSYKAFKALGLFRLKSGYKNVDKFVDKYPKFVDKIKVLIKGS